MWRSSLHEAYLFCELMVGPTWALTIVKRHPHIEVDMLVLLSEGHVGHSTKQERAVDNSRLWV